MMIFMTWRTCGGGRSYSRGGGACFLDAQPQADTPTHPYIMSEEGRVSDRQADPEPGSIEITA